jgi:hypothetical protein
VDEIELPLSFYISIKTDKLNTVEPFDKLLPPVE